jgi:AAA+ ATPase superfamily predicted ATPase
MFKKIIGREEEIATLKRLFESNQSEFLAVYGRRRVGKTFLIREFFNNEFTFYLTGVANATTKEQLLNFDLQLHQLTGQELQYSENWLFAFQKLKIYLSSISSKKKKVVFFDELPWLDTKNSDFMIGLEHFWNSFADARNDILFIACGSAASWMVNNLINNHGGLHNRLTERMRIYPFNLKETKAFLMNKGCQFTHYQIIELYMTMGGIPYYLDAIPKGKSATQCIQHLFFDNNSLLRDEFKQLYKALFKKHEIYEKVVEVLSQKNIGFNRSEILVKGKLKSGGTITKVLNDLEESGFISSYNHLSSAQSKTIYRLSDFYTAFYFRFLKNYKNVDSNFWINQQNQPRLNSWKGLAFEQVCLYHINPIKKQLGISGIYSSHYAWYGEFNEEKAQIDFIIDRQDNVINIVECKFHSGEVVIDKKYAEQLRRRANIFREKTKTKKAILFTMITTYGLNKNEYALDVIHNDMDMEALFG